MQPGFVGNNDEDTRPGTFVGWETGWPALVNIAAITKSTRDQTIDTRKRVYEDSGLDVPLSDTFDEAPNTTSYLLLDRQQPVGTVRLSVSARESQPHRTPAARIFGREIAESFGRSRLVEASRLGAVSSDSRSANRYYAIVQNVTRTADIEDCDVILAPTAIGHMPFYLSLGFEVIAGPRVYAWPEPVMLLALNWRARRGALRLHHRFRFIFSDWNRHESSAGGSNRRTKGGLRTAHGLAGGVSQL